MPYEFIFKIDGDVHWRCYLDSIRCIEHTKTGAQCKRQTVIGSPYCYTHLVYKHHLRIKKSTIPNAGMGLFAVDPTDNTDRIIFKAGQTIVKYKGEIIDTDELNERYGEYTAPYTVSISRDRYEDAAQQRGIGSIANTKPNHNNATISVHNGYASLKATKNIRNNQEIFLSYGNAYKLHEDGVEHETKYVRKKDNN